MKNLKYFSPCFVSIIIILSGCKTTSLNFESAGIQTPASFSVAQNRGNSASVSWAEYFHDPSLVNLIDEALRNNMDLQMAQQRISASKADVLYNKGLLLPSVQASTAAGRMKLGEYSAAWAGNEGGQYANGETMRPEVPDYFVGFQTSWELDVWGKLRSKKRAAISRYFATVEGKNWMVTNLIAQIANTYYQLQALDTELEMIRETIQLQENAVFMVKVQKDVGVSTALAVQQFEARLLSLKSLEREGLQRITEVENSLNVLLGRFPQSIVRSSGSIYDSMPDKVHAGIPSELLVNRPDIRESEMQLLAAKADVKSARAAFFPVLSITGGVGYNAFSPTYLFSSPQSIAYNLFGNLAAPVLNRSAIKADFAKANALQVEALHNYQKRIIVAFDEVSSELSNIQNLQAVHDFRKQEVEVLNKSVQTCTDLFRTGRATYLEVLLTQQTTLQAKLALIDARKRHYQASVNIYKALGGGWR